MSRGKGCDTIRPRRHPYHLCDSLCSPRRYAKLTGATHTVVEDEYADVKGREGALKLLVMTNGEIEVEVGAGYSGLK